MFSSPCAEDFQKKSVHTTEFYIPILTHPTGHCEFCVVTIPVNLVNGDVDTFFVDADTVDAVVSWSVTK